MSYWLRLFTNDIVFFYVAILTLMLIPSVQLTALVSQRDSSDEDETRGNISPKETCGVSTDCRLNEECNSGRCECKPYTYFNTENDECKLCPLVGHVCTTCCGDNRLDCLDNICTLCRSDDGTNYCKGSEAIIMTASQIALSAALIMGITALGTLLYRICVRTNYPRPPTRIQATSIENAEHSGRVSVSSVQERVLSRLRDRPPRYENQHNSTQRRSAPEPPITVLPTNCQSLDGEAPPTYDDGTRDASTLPPPYSEVIQMTVNHRSVTIDSTDQDCLNGNLNPAFISSETSSVQVIEQADINEDIKPNDSLNHTSDKVVHI